MYQQPHDEPSYPPQQQVIYVQQPPVPAKPKNKTMKTMAIIFIAVGLALSIFTTVPTYGVLFGVLWFTCNAMGLVFLCLI